MGRGTAADASVAASPKSFLTVQRAYWTAWADAVRPLADGAGSPELKAALAAHVADLDRRAAGGKIDPARPLSTSIGELCLR